ncbi:MAG TPA: alpha/beta hydrolase [Tepidisphaeraceae bacterium]|nr:alpha/beta hydrolase [Tepidisphaeraceae bacterium]
MPWDLAHAALRACYALLPIFYAGLLLNRAYQRRDRAARHELLGTSISALAIGTALAVVYALAVGGRVRVDQCILAALYFFAVLIVLKGLDAAVRAAVTRLLPAPPEPSPAPGNAPNRIAALTAPEPTVPRKHRVLLHAARALVLIAVGLPYVMAAAMAYRPKVGLTSDPFRDLNWRFEPVTFPATDGLRISAWYIPAPPLPPNTPPDLAKHWARRTVICAHGLGANKLNQLHMARAFHARGWNVLALDFRAHGASAGQFSTFGDTERRDVLGAVRHLRTHRAANADHIVCVGASLGAAASIAAAADDSAEGRAIAGLVVYATYADLGDLARSICDTRLPFGTNLLARHVAIPLASLHAGSNLSTFRPAEHLARLGNRPLFLVHGKRDVMIPIAHAHTLHAAAPGPKRLVDLDADHNAIIDDEPTARAAAAFFDAVRE